MEVIHTIVFSLFLLSSLALKAESKTLAVSIFTKSPAITVFGVHHCHNESKIVNLSVDVDTIYAKFGSGAYAIDVIADGWCRRFRPESSVAINDKRVPLGVMSGIIGGTGHPSRLPTLRLPDGVDLAGRDVCIAMTPVDKRWTFTETKMNMVIRFDVAESQNNSQPGFNWKWPKILVFAGLLLGMFNQILYFRDMFKETKGVNINMPKYSDTTDAVKEEQLNKQCERQREFTCEKKALLKSITDLCEDIALVRKRVFNLHKTTDEYKQSRRPCEALEEQEQKQLLTRDIFPDFVMINNENSEHGQKDHAN